MLFLVGVGIFALSMLLSVLVGTITNLMVAIAIIGLGIAFVAVVISKPKYGERKLYSSYKLLPITSGVYAVRTCDNKVVFKYEDFNDDGKVLIDILGVWKEVVEISEGELPVLNIYVQKSKKTWNSLPLMTERYIEVLRIPKGSIITE